jgi:outer membrane protein assembly factor BamA
VRDRGFSGPGDQPMHAMDRSFPPARRLAGALLGVLVCGLTALAQAPAARVVVADVVVDGNKLTPTQQITTLLKTRAGADYNADVVQQDVRTLYATKQFANVQADMRPQPDGRVVVYFLVRDLPSVIQRVVYHGARHLGSDDEISKNITHLHVGDPLHPTTNKIAAQAIVNKLNEDGRPFASCDLLRGDQPNDTEVIFNISEGPQARIGSIGFEGNAFVDGSVLKTHIQSTQKGPLGLLFPGKLNQPLIDADIAKLEDYYKSFGYLDVKVSRDLRWSPDGRDVELVFHVHEGIRYQVKDAPKVSGATSLPPEKLEPYVQVKAGQYYNQADVDKDLAAIKDVLGVQGREARVQHATFYAKDAPGVCTVQYEVIERPPARVGQIFIVGNTRTRQDIILNQVPLYPGQVLSFPAVRESERNLARLGIFKATPENHPTVTVIDDPANPDSEFKDVLVTVEEDNTGSLLFGVGVNSDAGLTGSIVLNEHNFDIARWPTSLEDMLSGNAFRGGGQELRLEAVPGTQLQRYTMSWREPFLFNSPYSLGVNAYYYDHVFNEDDESRLGGRVTVGRRLNEYWTVSGSFRAENVGIHNVSPFAPPVYQEVVGNNTLIGFRAGVTYDDRDSFLRPTKGQLLDISYEQVTGTNNYPLVNVDFNKYFTVWQRADGTGRHVIALHSAVGWAGTTTPVYERFYAGGFRSIRGFEFRGVGPDINGFKVGGDFMLLNSLEYQVPVKANDSIMLVGFIDSGTVEERVDIKDYRVAAGFGVRVVVPMLGQVPIALDFGFPIVKGPRDNEQVFSFWLGFFR